jgi:hypothetical protein
MTHNNASKIGTAVARFLRSTAVAIFGVLLGYRIAEQLHRLLDVGHHQRRFPQTPSQQQDKMRKLKISAFGINLLIAISR